MGLAAAFSSLSVASPVPEWGAISAPSEPSKNLMQQAAMLLLADLIFDEAGLLQVDLVGELQAAGRGHRPHGTARRGEGGHDLVQHGVVELGRSDIRA